MTVRILITGGFGYIGGRIAAAFANRRDFQLVLATRHAPQSRPAWCGEARIAVIDLDSAASLDAACADCDCIIHLAALNEIDSVRDPALAWQVNTLGTQHMLAAAQRNRVRRFIYLSTAHVYGAPLAGRIDESTLPRPRHPYAITHRAAEDLVLAVRDAGVLEGMVLRLSNGFGAPAHAGVNRWTLLANDLCRQAVVEGALTLNSPGLQLRDFVTLADVTAAAAHLATLPDKAAADGLFNLGGENPLRVCDMAERIAERCTTALGFRPEIRKPAATGHEAPQQLDFRIDKLKATGFALRGDVDGEIDATLRLCREAFQRSN